MTEYVFEGRKDLLQSEIMSDNLILNIRVDFGKVIVDYLEEDDPRQIAVAYHYKYNSVSQNPENPFSFSCDHQVENDEFSVQIECRYENKENMDIVLSNMEGKVHILIPPKRLKKIEISSDLKAGNLILRLEEETLSDLILKTHAGKNAIFLSKCILTQDVHFSSEAGAIDFSFTDIKLEKPLSMIVTNQAGPITGLWLQSIPFQNNIEMITSTAVGLNQLEYKGRSKLAKYELSFQKAIGKIDMNTNISNLQQLSKRNFQTTNFDSINLPTIDISMKSQVGLIKLDITEE